MPRAVARDAWLVLRAGVLERACPSRWPSRSNPAKAGDDPSSRQAVVWCADVIRVHASLYFLYILLVHHRVPQTLGQEGSHGSPFVTYTIHVPTRSSVVIHLCLFGNPSTSLLSTHTSRRRVVCMLVRVRSCRFVHVSTNPRDSNLPSPSLWKGTKRSDRTRIDSGSHSSGLGSAEPRAPLRDVTG